MSDSTVIRIENLGKKYRIGVAAQRPKNIREAIQRWPLAPLRYLRTRLRKARDEEILWALKDVSFDVERGEVIGLIGHNGAGKSTLLKILSRITDPTEGRALVKGRVNSLLEVGTGFHPELTGRENIYLSSAIHGVRKTHVDAKFDEIVDFAGVGKFIDTPIKRYSSGMHVRLGFAVAAYLEPDILLVDEVLAVGDAEFQKKCLGKMGEVAKGGRTVLLVSHNMGAITSLCGRCVLLSGGRVGMIGDAEAVVGAYFRDKASQAMEVALAPPADSRAPVFFTRLWVGDPDGHPLKSVDVTQAFAICMRLRVKEASTGVDVTARVYNSLGHPLFSSSFSDWFKKRPELKRGETTLCMGIPGEFLAPGTYALSVAAHRPNVEILDDRQHALTFRVEESGSHMWQYHGTRYGDILVKCPWACLEGGSGGQGDGSRGAG